MFSSTVFLRGLKDMESEISSIEKRFAYGFLQKLLKWMEIAQEFIAHLGTVVQGWATDTVTSDRPYWFFFFFFFWAVLSRGCGEQRASGKISSWTGNQILRQGMVTGPNFKWAATFVLITWLIVALIPLRSWCLWSISISKTTAFTSCRRLQRFWVAVDTLPIKRKRWLQGL